MGLSSMNLFIRLTERTYTVFNRFDKPEGHPMLLSSGMATDWAAFADLLHASVSICYRKYFHKCPSYESCRFEKYLYGKDHDMSKKSITKKK